MINQKTSIKESSRILLLYGGNFPESDVSIKTAQNVSESLTRMNYNFVAFNIRNDYMEFLHDEYKRAKKNNVRLIVFNALHGDFGEDGTLPALLDLMDIEYTHSGASASILAINKALSSHIANTENIAQPEYKILQKNHWLQEKDFLKEFDKYILVPTSMGSSIGLHIVSRENIQNFLETYDFLYGDIRIAHYYENAKELSFGIFEDQPIESCITICPPESEDCYNYEAKYLSNKTKYIIDDPSIPKDIFVEGKNIAKQMHDKLGCTCISRSDFLYHNNKLYFMEINTHPGLTSSSLIPKMLNANGMSFDNMIEKMIQFDR